MNETLMTDEELKKELRERNDVLLMCALLGLDGRKATHMNIEEHIDWMVKNHKERCIRLINKCALGGDTNEC